MQVRLAVLVPAIAIATATVFGACSSNPSAGTSQPPVSETNAGDLVDIAVRNYAFEPAAADAGSNTRVVWTVTEGTHDVMATDGAGFDSGPLAEGNTFTWSPDFAGSRTISYQCRIHPDQMRGTIQVDG